MAIYMPNGRYGEIGRQLIAAGLSPQTPCLVVSNASRAEQELLWTDVAGLRLLSPPDSPALLIIGSVARCCEEIKAAPSSLLADFKIGLQATR
jgi:siroheme synthase